MRFVAVIGWILGLVVCGHAQDQGYSLRNYKAIDGLPQSQVKIILEDENGYLWIGTVGGGLARFDGRQFRVYTTLDGLLSNIVTSMTFDARQNLWIVHPRGISKFDGVTFTTFEPPDAMVNANRIRRAFELNDTLFFVASPGHLAKIYGDSVYYWSKPVRPGQAIAYAHLTPDKSMLLYYKDSSFYVRSRDGDYTFSHKGSFNRLYGAVNYSHQVWLSTDKGYFTIDFSKRAFEPASLPITNYIVHHDTINDVFWTRRGNTFLKEKLTSSGVSIDTVLKDVEVNQVFVDSEGNTWFATHGTGLFKYFIQDFDRYGPEGVNVVMAIHRDKEGFVWAGSATKGLWRIKDGVAHSYFDRKEPYRNEVHSIAEAPDGIVWVATSYGLGRYNRIADSFRWYTRADGLSSSGIISIAFDESGNLYAGSFNAGVNYMVGDSIRHFTVKEGLTSNMVSALHYSLLHKTLFIGNDFGVSALREGKVEPVSLREIDNAGVLSIHSFRDSLILIGSAGAGVAIYNPRSGAATMITRDQGLPSDFIYFAAADSQDFLWIGTEKGITRLRLDRTLHVLENLHYDYDNGLSGVETNQNAFYLADDLKLFGLVDGMYRFNDLERHGRRSFDLHLTSVELFYGEYPVWPYADSVAGFFKLPIAPTLPPDINHITFHYNRVDKRYPKAVKFRYLLENFDKTWSQTSAANEVTYSNLPPGTYTFRVMATDNQGSWSTASVAYPFTIRAPFYRTTSFIVGLFILFAGGVTLVLYIRVRSRVNKLVMMERIRTREQEVLRKEIARDFHDEMGNQLTRIINYVSILKLNGSSADPRQADLYAKVEDSAKYLYSGTRDFIWSIDPGNDELSQLFLHIRDFGEKLFGEKDIHFRAYNEVREVYKLPYGFSREANLIFKEAMTNAFKYACANNVTLTLVRDGDAFAMSFEDDGVGFETGTRGQSNGLKNIRERAERVRGQLEIQSKRNQGTRVVLRFTINKTLRYGLTL